jgi:tetratricopeptide (TPR) repeat protein
VVPGRPLSLHDQTAAALARGTFQKARELAKELCKQQPTPEHEHWLIEATLGRAVQLRLAGQTAEAGAMLRALGTVRCTVPELLARWAGELMLAGDWKTAGQLVQQIPPSVVQQRLATLRVDAAMLQGKPELAGLPADLQPAAQRLLQGLASLASGDDLAVEAAVVDVPKTSPLYDWLLLTQGLYAFYTHASTALGPWQQLTPERAPAAIAAPFRAQLDGDFLASQPPARQADLVAFGHRLYAETWLSIVDDVRSLLAQEQFPAALRRAAEALRAMPAAHQEWRQRLARLLYWEVVRHGRDRDIPVYAKIFGALAEDPELHRLRALHAERHDEPAAAQENWSAYEQNLPRYEHLRPEDRDLARALLWFHMGELAEAEEPPVPASLGLPLPPGFDAEEEFAFAASACYRRSIELAPQYLQAHEHLIDLLHAEKKQPEVIEAAQRLLTSFPEHQRALEALAEDAFRQHRWDDAVALQERAVRTRPHDRRLTSQLGFYQLGLARLRAQQGDFETARALLDTQMRQDTSADRYHILCRRAAVEFQAGQPQAGDAWFARACQEAPSRLVADFHMLIEALRLPLDEARIKPLERAFRRGLKAAVHAPSAVALLHTLYAFQRSGTSYNGLQAHHKLILQYLRRVRQMPMSEMELQSICTSLQGLPTNTLLLDFAMQGCQAFPRQPVFPFTVATYYLARGPEKCPWHTVQSMLHQALEGARGNPAHVDLARQIEALLPVVQSAMLMTQFTRGGRLSGRQGPAFLDMIEALDAVFGSPFDDDDDDDELLDFEEDIFDAPSRPTPRPGARQPKKRRPSRRR